MMLTLSSRRARFLGILGALALLKYSWPIRQTEIALCRGTNLFYIPLEVHTKQQYFNYRYGYQH